jgi:hypothetical protein
VKLLNRKHFKITLGAPVKNVEENIPDDGYVTVIFLTRNSTFPT